MDPLLEFACTLADASGEHLRGAFRRPFAVEAKADASPVTEVDRAVEKLLRERLRAAQPDHGILGEEFGAEGLDREHVWVLDPIDGTRSFVAGKPLFGTLIGLARGGQPLLGVIDHPATGERWAGHAEGGTSFQGEATRVSEAGQRLSEAIVATTAPHLLREASAATFLELRKDLRDVVYGCDCYAYGLLASGHLHAVVEEDLGVHDWCALVPVVQGAGGIVTDWRGNALRITDPAPDQVIAAATPQLHEELLERFSPHAR